MPVVALVCNPNPSIVELGGLAVRRERSQDRRTTMRHATFLITGTTPLSYHDLYSEEAVKRIATQEGFVPFRALRINAVSTVEVWRRVG